jgi:CheY-like chemotaxis protein
MRGNHTMGLQALTIEDSSIVRKILRERLKGAGWDVIEASTASEGWELFQSLRPQLVTLDIVMPSAHSTSHRAGHSKFWY